MKKEDLLNGIGKIDEKIVDEYINATEAKKIKAGKRRLRAFIPLAACIALLACAVPILSMIVFRGDTALPPKVPEGILMKIDNIIASKQNEDIIENDTEFIIYAEDAKIEEVKEHLYLDPPLDYTIEQSGEGKFTLTPREAFSDSTVVSLSYVTGGVKDYSWAFQTKSALSVSGTYPANGAYTVSEQSVIEIEFSCTVTDDISDKVSITPAVDGRWSCNGRLWRFTPDGELSPDTRYSVVIADGISADGMTMESAYSFVFGTYKDEAILKCTPDIISADGITSYRTGEAPYIAYNDESSEKAQITRVTLARFASAEDMIKHRNGEKAQKGEPEERGFHISELGGKRYLVTLDEALTEGYYTASVYAGEVFLFDWTIQVNRLTAYAFASEYDIVVWAADSDGLAGGEAVSYNDISAVTDENGSAVLKGACDGSGKMSRLYIGDKDCPLTVGITNEKHDNWQPCFIYTDRPMYKTNDTIKIWGYVPLPLYYGGESFNLSINNEGEKIPVTLDEYGTFTAEYKLENHMTEDSFVLNLQCEGINVAYTSLEIIDYVTDNYSYEMSVDNRFIFAGDTFELTVRVTHITGIPAVGKDVCVIYCQKEYTAKADENGCAHFTITNKAEQSYYSQPNNQYTYSDITVKGTDETLYIAAFLYGTVFTEPELEGNRFSVSFKKLDLKEMTEADIGLYNNQSENYDAEVSVEVVEVISTRSIVGYSYDEYAKKKYPVYSDFESSERTVDAFKVQTANGTAEFDYSAYKPAPSTDVKLYRTDIRFTFTDSSGELRSGICTLPAAYENAPGCFGEYGGYYNNSVYSGSTVSQNYYVYRYLFDIADSGNREYSSVYGYATGDTIGINLYSCDKDEVISENNGKVMRIVTNKSFIDTEIMNDTDSLSYNYTAEAQPYCLLTGVYYNNGVFYRMPVSVVRQKYEEKALVTTITPDKEEYTPGSEVKLDIKVTDKNGNAVSSAVNISVVRESVFAEKNDSYNDFQKTVYNKTTYPAYTYSAFYDYEINNPSGIGGGDTPPRSAFGDTAYFAAVKTDESGTASVTFTLPDSVTVYRVTAHAAGDDMYIGKSVTQITCAMDFFIEYEAPRSVKASDTLVLSATGVNAGAEDVSFEFSIAEIGKTITAYEKANRMAYADFGKLAEGTYTARITARCGEYSDAVEFPVEIVSAAQQVPVKTTLSAGDAGTVITPCASPVTLEVCGTDTERILSYLDSMSQANERLDTLIGQRLAAKLRSEMFGDRLTPPSISYTGSLLRPLNDAGEDMVLTALAVYFDKYNIYNVRIPEQGTEQDIVEYYMLRAARGDAVLGDLLYIKDNISGSADSRIRLSLAFAFLGDYGNALAVYESAGSSAGNAEGASALRALAATFIDRRNAGIMLDALQGEHESELYLDFALASYIINNSAAQLQSESVTVKYGNETQTVTVSGLEIKTIIIKNEKLTDISVTEATDGVKISYYYQGNLAAQESKRFKCSLEARLSERELAVDENVTLSLDLSSTTDDYGEIRVALPNGLRYNNAAQLPEGIYLVSDNPGYVILYKTKNAEQTVEIPLYAAIPGEYVFEEITYGGISGYAYSPRFGFTVVK